jgi:hypothetical protein
MDLLDLYRGTLSPRKLGVLVDFLPPESATHTALRNEAPEPAADAAPFDAAKGRWSALEMLLATLIDETRLLRWVYVSAHSEKGASGGAPDPVRRPGAEPRRSRGQLTPEQRRMLDPRLRLVGQEDTTA